MERKHSGHLFRRGGNQHAAGTGKLGGGCGGDREEELHHPREGCSQPCPSSLLLQAEGPDTQSSQEKVEKPVKNPKPVFFQVTVSKARVISVLFFRALENKHFGVRLKLMRLFKPSLRSAGVADPKLREVKGISPPQTHRALKAFTSTSPVTAERHSDTGNPLMASRNKEKKKEREGWGWEETWKPNGRFLRH